MSLDAVLFDLDGTLVDSEPVWELAVVALAEHLGARVSAPALAATLGVSQRASVRIVFADIGMPLDRASIDAGNELLTAFAKRGFARGVPWRPGAAELLSDVGAAGVPRALVTSADRVLVELALKTVGREHFGAIVCGDEVDGRTKPDPAPYVMAAQRLGVNPAACVAVEDSAPGVVSARLAGCVVVAVPRAGITLQPGPRTVVLESLRGVSVDFLRATVG